MKSMAVTMPVMAPFAPVRRAASLLAFANSLHTSVTVVSSGAVTGGCGTIQKQQQISKRREPLRQKGGSRA